MSRSPIVHCHFMLHFYERINDGNWLYQSALLGWFAVTHAVGHYTQLLWLNLIRKEASVVVLWWIDRRDVEMKCILGTSAVIVVAGTALPLSDSVKIIVVQLDSNLTMISHTMILSISCVHHICSIYPVIFRKSVHFLHLGPNKDTLYFHYFLLATFPTNALWFLLDFDAIQIVSTSKYMYRTVAVVRVRYDIATLW